MTWLRELQLKRVVDQQSSPAGGQSDSDQSRGSDKGTSQSATAVEQELSTGQVGREGR
jgi:hypothetical protein